MLNANPRASIKLATNSGPALTISKVKDLSGKNRDGKKSGDDSAEIANDDKATPEKMVSNDGSINSIIKAIKKNVQQALLPNDKNLDPNAPINSEKNPARFDGVAGKQFASDPATAAARYGLYPPPAGAQAQYENVKNQLANNGQVLNPIGSSQGSGFGGSGGGGFGGGSSQGGSGGGYSGGGVYNPGNGGVYNPGHGGSSHQHSSGEIFREFRASNVQVTESGWHIMAPAGQMQSMQKHYGNEYQVTEVVNQQGQSSYTIAKTQNLPVDRIEQKDILQAKAEPPKQEPAKPENQTAQDTTQTATA